jgi:hypothetical protein
MMKEDYSRPQS